MKDKRLKGMESFANDKNPLAKFLRIQRSIAAFPLLAIYAVVGSYFTELNFFHMTFVLGGLALYLLSVAVNGYNNLFDIEEDKLATSSGIAKANYLLKEFTWSQLKWNFALTSIALACVVILIGNLQFAALCAFTYALGIIYTKPVRLKNRPLIGTVSNTFGFSILPILSSFFLLKGNLTVTIAFCLAAFFPTFSSCLIAEIADLEIDKKIGTRTTANWFGKNLKNVIKGLLIISVILFFIALVIHWAVILVAPYMMIILYETWKLYTDFTDMNADYALIKIGGKITIIWILYVLISIVIHQVAPTLISNIF